GGKWSHMMDQTHIGYTYWQQPPFNKMPEVKYVDAAATIKKTEAAQVNEPAHKTYTYSPFDSRAVNEFYEKDGYVSIEAAHFSRALGLPDIKWQVIPNLGKTGSALTPFPATAKAQVLSPKSPHVFYIFYTSDTGLIKLHTYLSPTLNFHNEGLRYAISIDEETPQVINMHEGYNEGIWNGWVANNNIDKVSEHRIQKGGRHVLKFWMVDPGVVIQKLIVDFGGMKKSYLGPPETKIK
ncbi:MAG TPA: hypothetical protein VM888_12270, partial [Chitinophagaceae bacterium]|nr:hypothetical protein [Chitinophagaceae bacterium]